MKDRKVLGILQTKDDKIDDLQKTITGQSKELSIVMAKWVTHLISFLSFSLLFIPWEESNQLAGGGQELVI